MKWNIYVNSKKVTTVYFKRHYLKDLYGDINRAKQFFQSFTDKAEENATVNGFDVTIFDIGDDSIMFARAD